MKFQRKTQEQVQVNLIPMIDIVFQLVVFFMLTSTFAEAPGIKMDLPTSDTKETISMELLIITAQKDGTVFFGNEVVGMDGLRDRLAGLSDDEKKRIVFQGDAEISYQNLIDIWTILIEQGIRGTSLRTLGPNGE